MYDEKITTSDELKIIKNLRNGKAPTEDNILCYTNVHLKTLYSDD
jgi:hypothetical protein